MLYYCPGCPTPSDWCVRHSKDGDVQWFSERISWFVQRRLWREEKGSRLFVLTLLISKAPNHMLTRTITERVVLPGTRPNPDPHPPRECLSNSLGPVWANMYSDPFSSTTPSAAGIDNPDCVKWRETLPSQEESAGRDIPMGQLVTKVPVSRESPFKLPPCQLWPGHNSPVPRR